MAYLFPRDYQVNIQDVNINQIISADESIRNRAQLAGEAEAQSYLKQKYLIAREFQDILPWSWPTMYKAFNRMYLDGPQYIEGDTWVDRDLCSYLGVVYIANTTTTGVFNSADWDIVGKQYDIYYAAPPKPEFSYSALYNIGAEVFYNNGVYRCLVQTSVLDHDTALQYRAIQNLPQNNVAPDDPISGSHYWELLYNYEFVNYLPDDTQYWTLGDNRDAQMVLYTCDIVLYHLHARIAPRNIPELRVKRYDDAKAWLKMCAEGAITPNLPLIQPRQGNRIRYGGNIKQINTY
jgi:hypothetical protein